MTSPLSGLGPEVWVLVFRQLIDDHATLLNVSLVCRAWHTLSLPSLFRVVDLSSHNLPQRLTEHERDLFRVVYSHHHASYRPRNLVPRQHMFLRLMNAKPFLAGYVHSFTWTFVWKDVWGFNDNWCTDPLSAIDRDTWKIFALLRNVTHLDLASIHDVWDDYVVRETPARLFPQVTDLRLLGWMHRGLVRAIMSAIDPTRLHSLKLDYLEDQGALPGGQLLNEELAVEFAKNARRADVTDPEHVIDDDLFRRQENGEAAIFPGPMWYPMRLLSGHSLDALSHLQVTVPAFNDAIDLRNYYTFFAETANLIRSVSNKLKSLVVIFGELDFIHNGVRPGHCRGNYGTRMTKDRPWCIKMAATFLKQVVTALSEDSFPNLTQMTFKGFHSLELKSPWPGPDIGDTLSYIRNCRYVDVDFTGTAYVDERLVFTGFDDCPIPNYSQAVLKNS